MYVHNLMLISGIGTSQCRMIDTKQFKHKERRPPTAKHKPKESYCDKIITMCLMDANFVQTDLHHST